MHTSQKGFSDSFLLVFSSDIPLLAIDLNELPNVHLQNGQKQCFQTAESKERFNFHKAVSQKASFQFLTEEISFFTLALYGLPNIILKIPQEQS